MSTQIQTEANRLNAHLSTGPRTPEGKAVSRFNAMKHGIDARSLVIPGEDPEELAILAADYDRQFRPDGPVEQCLVRIIIKSDWYVRRYDRIEAAIIARTVGAADPAQTVPDLFANTNTKTNPLPHLFRRRQAAQRDWFRALKELQRLQKDRKESAETEPAKTVAAPPVGFDPQKRPAPSAAPIPPAKIAS